jgi:hypothetical protein
MLKYFIKNLLFKFLYLLYDTRGCGGGDDTPAPPTYTESPESRELKALLIPKVKSLTDLSYQDWLSRFTVPESPVRGTALEKYKGLFDTQDYSLADYGQTENEYLDTLLRKFKETRTEAFKPVQESLIAENLFGSGPGYGIMTKFGEETATGAADITKQWAYEGIQRKQTQQQYMDALKRGDYSTMYNLALSEEQRALQPILQASQAELASINPAMSLFGELSAEDRAKYEAALKQYGLLMQQEEENYGGLGSLLGGGAGLAIGLAMAPETGGLSLAVPLAGAGLGAGFGGGIGSMFGK